MVASRQELAAKSDGSRNKQSLRVIRGQAEMELDTLIHEKKRLAIVSALAVNASLSFNELKELLRLSDGNLSAHARKLEDAGYVQCAKGFEGRVPRTHYRLTAKGRRALDRYLKHMESLISAVKNP